MSPPSSARPVDWLWRSSLIGWIALVLVAVAWLDHLGRSRTFFYDEWNFVTDRWQLTTDTFLGPHNGHLSIVPASTFFVLFRTFGLDDYRVFRLVGLLVHVGVATSVLWYVRPRLGALAGFSAGAVILLLGTGWQNILWPFQIGFMGSVFCFVLTLLLLDRNDRLGDSAACVATAAGLGCSGVGAPAAVAVLIELVVQRSRRSRWWIAGGPLVLYGIWYVSYGESQADAANADVVPKYVRDSAAGALAGMFDLDIEWGRLLAGVVIGLAVATVVRRRRVAPRVLCIAAMLGGFWVLTALSRGQFGDPTASRYVYVGAVFVVLLASELVPKSHSAVVSLVAVALAIVSVWATSSTMRAGAGGLRLEGQIIGAELAVVETLQDRVPGGYAVDGSHAPGLLSDEYFEVVSGLDSSPAVPIDVVALMAPEARAGADRVLLELAPPRVIPAAGSPASCASSGTVHVIPGDSLFVAGGAGGAQVRFARFHDAPGETGLVVVEAGAQIEIEFLDDPIDRNWTAQLSGDPGAVMCSVP